MSTLIAHVALVSDTLSVSLADVSPVAAALQKQVTRDFGPIWDIDATVDAFDKLESVPVDYWPVILRDDINEPGAAGYHTDDHGQPFSLVQADQNWPLTASHETLEMLADPGGNRTIAGSPPPQAPAPISGFGRVLYLVEVADPCEGDQFAYGVNGVTVSDFITPHYYDPNETTGARYDFRGSITGPHTVLDAGYVSFGNPVDNHWYQIIVVKGKVQTRDLGVITATAGQSLREQVDGKVREVLKSQFYRIRSATSPGAPAKPVPFANAAGARARFLRDYVAKLRR